MIRRYYLFHTGKFGGTPIIINKVAVGRMQVTKCCRFFHIKLLLPKRKMLVSHGMEYRVYAPYIH